MPSFDIIMNRVYFKGLAEIRALAALFVIFHHLELYKHRNAISSLYDTPVNYFISHLGKNGVYIFFILSGFLITYLLLTEKKLNKKIDIRNLVLEELIAFCIEHNLSKFRAKLFFFIVEINFGYFIIKINLF